MNLNYYIIDPTRNTTILVDGYVPEAKQPEVAAIIMKQEPIAEQVGFISFNPGSRDIDINLRMAGGEFCGNATMSAAALFCEKAKLPHGESCDVNVRVSGVEKPIEVHIDVTESGKYRGLVNMPGPFGITERDFTYNNEVYRMPLVDFGGIAHIIATRLRDRNFAEEAVKCWCKELNCEALGLMLYDEELGRLDPLVYVPAADTLFWESSCASGTTAVGAYLAYSRKENINMKLKEPGGELTIEALTDGTLKLSGHVRILRKNYIENL